MAGEAAVAATENDAGKRRDIGKAARQVEAESTADHENRDDSFEKKQLPADFDLRTSNLELKVSQEE